MSRFSKLFTPKDLTSGTPWKRITEFTIPMLIGNIAQQFYNTADSIIVGKYVGDNALAAVGSASPILNLLLVIFIGISIGAGIMVSQYFGAKDREKLSHTIGICITLTAMTSVVIMIIGPIVTMPLLSFLNTPDSIIQWCKDYLIIYFVGIAGFAYYNILAGVLRGLGDSISALVFLLISTVLNVGLDLIFVAGFNMGVPGVALATVIAQSISAILCIIKLIKMKSSFDLNWKMLKLDKEYVLRLVKLGLPSGLTQAVFSLAMIVVQSRANRMDRVEKGTKDGTLIALGVSTFLTMIILVFGKQLMHIFTDTQELVDLSMHMMRILAVGYIAMAITQSLSGVMRGAGDTLTPMWISLFTTVVLRIPIAYGIAYFTRSDAYPTGRPETTFVSLLISWILGAVLTVIFYRIGNWRKKSFVSEFEGTSFHFHYIVND